MTRTSSRLATLFLSISPAFAQGTNIATAIAVPPSGSASSSMNDNSNNHYWKVTTTSNGYLRVQINSALLIGNFDVDMSIYDSDGSTYINGDVQTGSYSEAFAF